MPAPFPRTKHSENILAKKYGLSSIVIHSKTHPVYNIVDSSPDKASPNRLRSYRLHYMHLELNHVHTKTIRSLLKAHKHPEAGKLTDKGLICTSYKLGEMVRSPHLHTNPSTTPDHTEESMAYYVQM